MVAGNSGQQPPGGPAPPAGAMVASASPAATGPPGGPASVTRTVPFVLARSALLTGLCRFVPIPFLDDYLEEKARHYMVSSLLQLERRTFRARQIEPLYAGLGGCFSGCVVFVITLPFQLVLKLIAKLFKTVLFFLLLREVAMCIAETLLLGHTLQRLLQQGRFADAEQQQPGLLQHQATVVRQAFDDAFSRTDLRVLRSLLVVALRGVKGLPRAGARAVRGMFRKGQGAAAPAQLPGQDGETVRAGVAQLQATMERSEMVVFLEEFDRRFDAAWAAQAAAAAAASAGQK